MHFARDLESIVRVATSRSAATLYRSELYDVRIHTVGSLVHTHTHAAPFKEIQFAREIATRGTQKDGAGSARQRNTVSTPLPCDC